jgi:hypothetical protein
MAVCPGATTMSPLVEAARPWSGVTVTATDLVLAPPLASVTVQATWTVSGCGLSAPGSWGATKLAC